MPLERLFDNNVVYLRPVNQSSDENVISCNIGTNHEPKLVKISKVVSEEQRQKYVDLIKEYSDVFY